MPAWLQPWNDTPAKLRRDIQTAKAKGRSPAPAGDMPKISRRRCRYEQIDFEVHELLAHIGGGSYGEK